MLHLLAALALATRVAGTHEDSAQQRRLDLMAKLHAGGYTVLLRHARTDYSFKEEIGAVPAERNLQRNLNDDGIRDAALIGLVFRKYDVKFAEILASPMFRAVETAEMSVGKPTSVTMLLRVFPTTAEQAALVKTAPKGKTNRILITHHFVIETHVPGVKPGDVGESEAAVVQHNRDGSVQLIGLIKLDDWKALADPGYGQVRPTAVAPASAPPAHTAPVSTTSAAGSSPELPNTIPGHLARGYLAAFNSGDAEKMRAFIEGFIVADPARPTDERVKTYARIYADHGPLMLVGVDSATTSTVVARVHSKQGEIILTVKASDTVPRRAASVSLGVRGHGG